MTWKWLVEFSRSSYRVAMGTSWNPIRRWATRVRTADQGILLFVKDDDLATSERSVTVAAAERFLNSQCMALELQTVKSGLFMTGFDIEILAGSPAEARSVEGCLRVHLEVDHVHGDLDMCLRLVVTAHDSERTYRLAVFHQECWDDGLVRTLVSADLVRMTFFHAECASSGLQSETVFRHRDTGTVAVIAGLDHGAHRTVGIRCTEVAGIAGIRFTGFVEGRLLEELYSNAYVYVLPSDLEGMPLSLLEAMSYGNCCLVSDIPECTEVVRDKAATFRRGDPRDLRQALASLCADPARVSHYRQTARDYICEKYNWDDVTEKTLALYQKTR